MQRKDQFKDSTLLIVSRRSMMALFTQIAKGRKEQVCEKWQGESQILFSSSYRKLIEKLI